MHIRGGLLLEYDNLVSSETTKRWWDEEKQLDGNGFLAIVSQQGFYWLTVWSVWPCASYVIYIYGFSACSKILIRGKN